MAKCISISYNGTTVELFGFSFNEAMNEARAAAAREKCPVKVKLNKFTPGPLGIGLVFVKDALIGEANAELSPTREDYYKAYDQLF